MFRGRSRVESSEDTAFISWLHLFFASPSTFKGGELFFFFPCFSSSSSFFPIMIHFFYSNQEVMHKLSRIQESAAWPPTICYLCRGQSQPVSSELDFLLHSWWFWVYNFRQIVRKFFSTFRAFPCMLFHISPLIFLKIIFSKYS